MPDTIVFIHGAWLASNSWDAAGARTPFERYAVPETGRVFFEDGLANFTLHGPTEVDFDRSPRVISTADEQGA